VLEPWQVTVVGSPVAPGDLRALAARICGRSVGLVMAGGGARAFAHVGVLQELDAAGIVVDRVAGCSVGAIVAGGYAAGLDPVALQDVLYDQFVRRNPFNDYTIPTTSLAKGRRTRSVLAARLGGREIRALPRQFRCVSVDLLGRHTVAHRSGDLGEAVIASVSLPVLFPPLRAQDSLLIDGGVLDNLPVGLLTEREEGPTIAVNIAMGGGGGGRRTGPPRIPPLGDTLLRVMMIGSGGAVAAARAQGAYVVTPPPLGVGLLEFHQLDTVVEAGRMAARRLLEEAASDFPRVAATRPSG
jgi:predicted acylesterase/phospholipase RssA